ncbi:MAG: hypothetical protein ACOCVA_00950 [Prolixibacteraceae bacterium]
MKRTPIMNGMTHNEIKEGENYLVTTDGWWFAPDGMQYKSVWGKASIMKTEDVLGFTPLRPSTNWFICIGDVVIAGCQIHYLIRCPKKPDLFENSFKDGDVTVGKIYISET